MSDQAKVVQVPCAGLRVPHELMCRDYGSLGKRAGPKKDNSQVSDKVSEDAAQRPECPQIEITTALSRVVVTVCVVDVDVDVQWCYCKDEQLLYLVGSSLVGA